MGPTSREDFPQKEQVVTRRPRKPPGGRLPPPPPPPPPPTVPPGGGGVFGPPPLPGRLVLAIGELCLPCVRVLLRIACVLVPRGLCARVTHECVGARVR